MPPVLNSDELARKDGEHPGWPTNQRAEPVMPREIRFFSLALALAGPLAITVQLLSEGFSVATGTLVIIWLGLSRMRTALMAGHIAWYSPGRGVLFALASLGGLLTALVLFTGKRSDVDDGLVFLAILVVPGLAYFSLSTERAKRFFGVSCEKCGGRARISRPEAVAVGTQRRRRWQLQCRQCAEVWRWPDDVRGVPPTGDAQSRAKE
jgi:hypothetical protein